MSEARVKVMRKALTEKLWARARHHSNRAQHFQELAEKYRTIDPERSVQYQEASRANMAMMESFNQRANDILAGKLNVRSGFDQEFAVTERMRKRREEWRRN